MKANPRLRPAAAALLLGGALSFTVSCSEQRVEPTPAPTPAPPAPAPEPLMPPPAGTDWRDAPITPGVWEWRPMNGQSVARFAGGLLYVRCDPASRSVTLSRQGDARGPTAMRIVTSSTTRQVNATPQGGPSPLVSVAFSANDRLLDAMAFSRGRFAIETAGMPTLYVPSWPEVSRVIEDCR